MIRHLHIENYALIDELDIDMYPGFSVITGETGAGKSIILGAIGALVGQKVTASSLREDRKMVVEAVFDMDLNLDFRQFFEDNDLDWDDAQCIVRREVTAAGKSRAFVNDTPTQLSVLKELGDKLLDVHSQHQNLLLNKEDFQLSILDILAGNESRKAEYREAYTDWRSAVKALNEALEHMQRGRDDEEWLRFQVDQLAELNLKEGELAALEEEAEVLSHAEDIKGALYEAANLISSDGSSDVLDSLRRGTDALKNISDVYPAVGELAERLDSSYIELKDIAEELEGRFDDVEDDPRRLESVNERLDSIYTLMKKHHKDTDEELMALHRELQERLVSIDCSEERIEELREKVQSAECRVQSLGLRLTESRRKAAVEVQRQMTERLLPLGMPNVRFEVEMTQKEEADASGLDKVAFMFSANKNMALQNMSQVASGGEIARVMLSLKAMISGAVKLPTIIFDEIDTGVSGSIADKMAKIMREMGDNSRQVISITHLPQIAAMGQHHYKVYKTDSTEATNTHIAMLTEEERVEELASMLSGEIRSEAAISNAKVLLGLGVRS